MFTLRQPEFVVQEGFEIFEINEGKTGERCQWNIRDWQVGSTRFSCDLHQVPPHLDVRGAMQWRCPRQNMRLVAAVANNCANGKQTAKGGEERKPARGQKNQRTQGKPKPGNCDWKNVTGSNQVAVEPCGSRFLYFPFRNHRNHCD